MGKLCAMRTCKHADNITSSIKCHKFPSSVELRSKWDRFVVEGNRNKLFKSQASDTICLCERHFDPSCYTTHGKLKNDAVPTIADKFTPEVAFKCNLIPSLESELLVNINDFSKSIIERARTPEPESSASMAPMEVDEDVVPESILSSGMLELMVIDLGEESDEDAATFDLDRSLTSILPEVKQEETESDKEETLESEAHQSKSDLKDLPSLRLRSRTRTESKVNRVKSPSSSINRCKPGLAKKTTPVNTDSARRSRSRTSLQRTAHKVNSSPIPEPVPENSTKLKPDKTKTHPDPPPAKRRPQPESDHNSANTKPQPDAPSDETKPQPDCQSAKTKPKPDPQSAKTKPQLAKIVPSVNTVPDRAPSARLRSKASSRAKADKADRSSPAVTRTPDNRRRNNGLPDTNDRSPVKSRYLASGDLMSSIAFAFRVSRSSVSIIVRETCNAIWKRLYPLVFEHPSEATWLNVAANFEQRWNFPHCIGALDGKHVVVQAFKNSGSECFNYKGSHSVVLLALVGANYKFLVVDIGASGRCTDGGVFSSSLLGQALNSNSLQIPPPAHLPGSNVKAPFVIVADDAFPLKVNLMKPFPGEFLPPEQVIFNYRLSRARMVVENAFGILSARWRIYRKPIVGSRQLVHLIIKATVCLHNFMIGEEEHLRMADRNYIGPRTADMHDVNGEMVLGQWRNGVGRNDAIQNIQTLRMGARNASQAAKDEREKYVDFFLGPGAVAWQWQKLPDVDLQ